MILWPIQPCPWLQGPDALRRRTLRETSFHGFPREGLNKDASQHVEDLRVMCFPLRARSPCKPALAQGACTSWEITPRRGGKSLFQAAETCAPISSQRLDKKVSARPNLGPRPGDHRTLRRWKLETYALTAWRRPWPLAEETRPGPFTRTVTARVLSSPGLSVSAGILGPARVPFRNLKNPRALAIGFAWPRAGTPSTAVFLRGSGSLGLRRCPFHFPGSARRRDQCAQ